MLISDSDQCENAGEGEGKREGVEKTERCCVHRGASFKENKYILFSVVFTNATIYNQCDTAQLISYKTAQTIRGSKVL